ncbi:MAG: glycosyltransferase family 39 protein [Candidatus Aminicenantes bacterium]|nr:glycosyltransferase family 39 protein [Candidatus Aminicenantes bacterium]
MIRQLSFICQQTWSKFHPPSVLCLILLVFALTQLSAIGWDLPGTFTWENDGVAPRDIFAGIALNIRPGEGHNYPLFHYLILGLLCLPILLPAAVTAPDWSIGSLKKVILTVPVMTNCALVAKALAVAMSVVTILVLARIVRRTVNDRAAIWTALFAATNLSFAYYGRVTNLDGPYLMWTVLAIDRLLTIAKRGAPRDYILFGLFAAASVATKDQAYSTYVLVIPIYMIVLPLLRRVKLAALSSHWRYLGLAVLTGLLGLGVLGGGLINPTGFAARLSKLIGSSSQDWRQYAAGLAGIWANLRDLFLSQNDFWWPWPLVILAWLGVFAAVSRPGLGGLKVWSWRLLPLIAGVSSLAFFTLVVARHTHRFALPMGLWLAYYGGVGCEGLLQEIERLDDRAPKIRSRMRRIPHTILLALIVWAGGYSFQVHLTQWGDARRAVQHFLTQLPGGTVIETYGKLVYLPHFDTTSNSLYRVQRVGPDHPDKRNPIVGAEEIQAPFSELNNRNPDVLVIPEGFAGRFLPREFERGRASSEVWKRAWKDKDAREFFRAAVAGDLPGYRMVCFEPRIPQWAQKLGARPVVVHGSTGRKVWVFMRKWIAASILNTLH